MHAQLLLKFQPQVKLQQVISSTLLQVSGADLEQVIASELAANPALERLRERNSPSMRDSHYGARRPAQNGEHRIMPDGEYLVAVPSPLERLAGQLTLLVDGEDLGHALQLLHALDDHGYLRTEAGDLATELGIDLPAVERLIHILQELEPPGVEHATCVSACCCSAHISRPMVPNALLHAVSSKKRGTSLPVRNGNR